MAEGRCDIGLSGCRSLKDEEKAQAQGLSETVPALNGIAIIANPDNPDNPYNPLNDLAPETIGRIYCGEITNWTGSEEFI